LLFCQLWCEDHHQTKRNRTTQFCGVRIRESVWGFEAVVNKIAQAVIVEAEPHRRRFPNFACGRLVAITSPATVFTGRTPASGRSGEERDSAGDAALGMFVLERL
jgi:hypothetical protein